MQTNSQTQLTQCFWIGLMTSRGSFQISCEVRHEFWRCPSPLKVVQRSWGKPDPWRQLLWMKISIREGRINPPTFTYLFICLFINRTNRLHILFLPGVNIGWSVSHQERLHSDISNFALPSFSSSNHRTFYVVLPTQTSNSPNNPEGRTTPKAKLTRCLRRQNLVTLQQSQCYLHIFTVSWSFRFVQGKKTCAIHSNSLPASMRDKEEAEESWVLLSHGSTCGS